jgi:hypothetical protein
LPLSRGYGIAEHDGVSSELHHDLSDLSWRNHRRARTQRDVRVVCLAEFKRALWIKASGRARTAALRGRKSATPASSTAATAMAAECSRDSTIWNCWPCLTGLRQRISTPARSISTSVRSIPANPTCSSCAFMNLTHVYGCDPIAALAHVHPDQHALAYTIPRRASGTDLMYFANDGGIYRALDGFGGTHHRFMLRHKSVRRPQSEFGIDDPVRELLQHATNPNTLLGGTQDNGSPATATATTSSSWGNVLGGDGGYNAIDPNTGNWFASNPDTGSGTLNIQECSSG